MERQRQGEEIERKAKAEVKAETKVKRQKID
jgi:hypothetical protein